MIEIINISNYDNSIKKFKIIFWQWYKSRSLMWIGYIICCLLVFWLFEELFLNEELYSKILLFILIGGVMLAIYELIAPFISYSKNKKKIKEKFGISTPYEIIYKLHQDSITYPEFEGSEIKYIDAKYSSFRSIIYSSKNNAILFRKSFKIGAIVVLLDNYDEKKKDELFLIITSLKKK